MSASTAIAPSTGLSALLDDVRIEAPGIEVRPPSAETAAFAYDAATAPRHGAASLDGPAVAFPTTAEQVQQLVRLAGHHGVSVVPRGAGTGLSGGATATEAQLVIATDRLDRIVEISPADEVAVVEPGVLNAALNERLAPLGLFYAPTPRAGASRPSAETSPPTPGASGAPSTASRGNRCWPWTWCSPTAASSRWVTVRSKA